MRPMTKRANVREYGDVIDIGLVCIECGASGTPIDEIMERWKDEDPVSCACERQLALRVTTTGGAMACWITYVHEAKRALAEMLSKIEEGRAAN